MKMSYSIYGQGQGYDGYSMSVNARNAYEAGEMPFSKWTKSEIIKRATEANNSEILPIIEKLKLDTLKSEFLYNSGWHHTSKFYNKTDFYAFDIDKFNNMKKEEATALLEKQGKQIEQETAEEFDPKVIAKQFAEAQKKHFREKSTESAYAWISPLFENWQYEQSQSGAVYKKGRKPTSTIYEKGLENFFQKGENRLRYINDRYVLQTWDGNKWIDEKGQKAETVAEDTKYSLTEFILFNK